MGDKIIDIISARKRKWKKAENKITDISCPCCHEPNTMQRLTDQDGKVLVWRFLPQTEDSAKRGSVYSLVGPGGLATRIRICSACDYLALFYVRD